MSNMPSDMQRLRHVPLEGMTNLRNLGGYRTRDGTKRTRWGVLYRGDQPSNVPADVAQQVLVQRLHITSTFDLRDGTETVRRSYAIPHICRHSLPIDMSRMNELLPPNANVNEGPVAFRLMQSYYQHLVRKEGPAVGAIIKAVLRTSPSLGNAALIHCTGGKDRTGWIIYTLLSLLDVAETEKQADYVLTNTCFQIPKEAYEYEGAAEMSAEAFKAFWCVSLDYLDAAVSEVNALGGMDAYAKSHMGLTDADIQQLRDVMLEEKEQ
jgi:protein-tyrosine phosphatase